ncbi:TRAP transporter large permease [Elioraea sp. Yellowstone]|jgi:tripartite ATP-independent transporter DctM subunit|uniref:TRAP transporter large permease n=1 Tax=Elioraea sp. Yellowstone TaxID=2592070 RepID=UPI001154AA25|nr:TRAP transporter large permease [Elioraea sp. Yellowstone]TQF77356.1 TRAP transporter large permease [Elioraea sp. Yellowstone]
MTLIVLFGSFVLALAMGMPVAFAMAGAAVAGFWWDGVPLAVVFQQMTSGMNFFSLLAIPFFIFAGEVMLHGGIAQRLVDLAAAAFGWLRGGLGVMNVFDSMLFGGISGSAVADVSALGSVVIPMMRKKGYDTDYAVNVTITSSIAGIMIPPSHNMVLYSLAAGGGVSVSALFMAGVVPGVMMCVILAVAAYLVALRRGYPAEPWGGVRRLIVAFLLSVPGLMTAVIILGGVLSGIFTVTESAAFGAAWALAVTLIVYRGLSWNAFVTTVAAAVRTTSMVLILVGAATAFAWVLAAHRVPEQLLAFMTGLSDKPWVIFLLVNLAFLALGCIMDMAALILICTPIFLPVVQQLGMDPVQFGMVMMMNLGLGLTTPPVGACLFVGCAIAKVRIESVVRTIWPFWGAIVFALALTTYWPAVSLTLPRLTLGYGG